MRPQRFRLHLPGPFDKDFRLMAILNTLIIARTPTTVSAAAVEVSWRNMWWIPKQSMNEYHSSTDSNYDKRGSQAFPYDH